MTGMRTAQTRGGKKFWRGWSESTKGWGWFGRVSYADPNYSCPAPGRAREVPFIWGLGTAYHEQRPEGVVEEDDRGGHEHGDAHEFVKLRTWEAGRLVSTCRRYTYTRGGGAQRKGPTIVEDLDSQWDWNRILGGEGAWRRRECRRLKARPPSRWVGGSLA